MNLNYNELIKDAMRNIIKSALKKIEKITINNICLMIVVDTKNRYLKIPTYLKKQYPKEINIILQHQFSNLKAKSSYFSVDLNFSGRIENLVIPYKSLLLFIDQKSGIELKFKNFELLSILDEYCNNIIEIEEEYEVKADNDNFADNNLIKFEELLKFKKVKRSF